MTVADPAAAARYYVPMLRQLSDLVLLLTHQLFEADSPLAASVGEWSAEVDGEKVELMAVLGTSTGGFGTADGKGAAMGYLVADLVRTSAASDLAFIAASSVDPELPEGPIACWISTAFMPGPIGWRRSLCPGGRCG